MARRGIADLALSDRGDPSGSVLTRRGGVFRCGLGRARIVALVPAD
jgi:hypothetical protein